MKLKRIFLMVVALLMTFTFHGCKKENKYQDDFSQQFHDELFRFDFL